MKPIGQLFPWYASACRAVLTLSLAALLHLPGGCGSGLAGIIGLSSSGGGGSSTTRVATSLVVETPAQGASGRVPLHMVLVFDRNETIRLLSVEFSLFGADGPFIPATVAQGHPTDIAPGGAFALEATAIPVENGLGVMDRYRFDWNSHHDLDALLRGGMSVTRPATGRAMMRVTIVNANTGLRTTLSTDEFFLDESLVRTVAGGGVGDGSNPQFSTMLDPTGISRDDRGNLLIADTGNNRIRKITLDTTVPDRATLMETTVGNGFRGVTSGFRPATTSGMNFPRATAVTPEGNVYVAELDDTEVDPARRGIIRYVDRRTDLIFTVLAALVESPRDLELEPGRSLFVSDDGAMRVREFDIAGIDPLGTPITSFIDHTGNILDGDLDGTPDKALVEPTGIAFQQEGARRLLFVADRSLKEVYRLDLDSDLGTRILGGGAVDPHSPAAIGADGTDLGLSDPQGVAVDASHLFVVDKGAEVVIVVRLSDAVVANVIPGLVRPTGIEELGGRLFVCEASQGRGIVVETKVGHRITVIENPTVPGADRLVDLVAQGSVKTVSQDLARVEVQSFCAAPDQTNSCGMTAPTVDGGIDGTADAAPRDSGQATPMKAAATEAPLARPSSVLLDPSRKRFFVADTGNSVVCKVDEATGLMAVVAGSFDDTDRPPSATPRPARSVRLDRPKGLALDTAGRRLFIANSYREPRDPNDADFGGNVLVLDFNEPDDPDDDTVAVLVPNVKVEVNARIEQPAALAYHRFASGEETLFILDRGRLDASADASKPRPALYRVDVGSLAGDIEVGDVDPVSLGMESIGFVCDPGDPNDPADDFITSFRKTTCDPGDLNSRCAPWIPRFLEDIQPVDLPDDGLGLLVSLDAMDQFIEAGDAGVDTLGFEVNCHDGNGLDAASPDCTRPMRSVLLLLRFDDLGMQNENGTLTLLQGFKRFALEGVTPRCNCGNPATDSLIDVADLVLGPISSTADGRLVFTVDACRGDVTFAAFDESWMLLRTGRVAGADPATARSFDGAPPLDTAFGRPQGLAVDELQNLTIVDTLNNRVRRTYVGDQVR